MQRLKETRKKKRIKRSQRIYKLEGYLYLKMIKKTQKVSHKSAREIDTKPIESKNIDSIFRIPFPIYIEK